MGLEVHQRLKCGYEIGPGDEKVVVNRAAIGLGRGRARVGFEHFRVLDPATQGLFRAVQGARASGSGLRCLALALRVHLDGDLRRENYFARAGEALNRINPDNGDSIAGHLLERGQFRANGRVRLRRLVDRGVRAGGGGRGLCPGSGGRRDRQAPVVYPPVARQDLLAQGQPDRNLPHLAAGRERQPDGAEGNQRGPGALQGLAASDRHAGIPAVRSLETGRLKLPAGREDSPVRGRLAAQPLGQGNQKHEEPASRDSKAA